MKQMNLWKKVIWAVDPFAQESKLQVSAAWALRTLVAESRAQVEPVYILNEQPLGVPTVHPDEILRQTENAAQEELDGILARVKIMSLLPLRVIAGAFSGQREVAQKLVSYAKEAEAGLIVLSTHARKGLPRLFMGSFAESLMLYSDIPLFVVNPSWKSVTDFKHILFPTDFTDESKNVFGSVIELAKTLKADLTVFHQIPYMMSPEIQASYSAYPVFQDVYENELKTAQGEANRMMELAKDQGVEARTHIEYKYQGSAASSILEFSRKKHFIVAMAARGTRVSTALLGSTARRVVRESNYPVWVIHPEQKETGKVIPLETKIDTAHASLRDSRKVGIK